MINQHMRHMIKIIGMGTAQKWLVITSIVVVCLLVVACKNNSDTQEYIPFTYWIQNSDFSSPSELSGNDKVESKEHILSILATYDWAAQNAYEKSCLEQNGDCAPAGLGLIAKPGVILHICPKSSTKTALIHLHDQQNGTQVKSYQNVPFDYFETIVSDFLQEDISQIKSTLEGYKF